MKHRGIKIVPVKVTKFEVRDVSGRKIKTFSTAAAARSWVSGFATASDLAAKAAGAAPPAPPKKTKPKGRLTMLENAGRLKLPVRAD